MRSRVWGRRTLIYCLPLLVVLGLAGKAGAAGVTLQVTPDVVEINSFFNGHKVTVTGTVPAGSGAVVEVAGPTAEEHLRRKGRRGPLWMNVGNIAVSGAPSLYLVLSSAADLLSGDRPEMAWGFPALFKRITLSGDIQENEQAMFREQFLELKQSEQLYGAWPGGLKVSPAEGGRLKVTGTFWLPSNVKPDTYKVCLTAVQDGQAAERLCTDLTVQMVGFPAFIMTMAYQRGVLYGILAVIIAIIVGFLMGYLFKGGGGH
jgi:hypothetical protein